MVQSPVEPSPLTQVGPTPPRYGSVTIVMNPPVREAEQTPDPAARPQSPRETVPFSAGVMTEDVPQGEPTIEQYMAELLARTRPYAPMPEPAVTQPFVPRSAPGKPAPEMMPEVAAIPALPPAPVTETRDTFSELRELANISARSTFNVHRVQRIILDMHGQRFVILVAMLATLFLLSLAQDVRSPNYVAAIVAGITACVWSLKYLARGRRLAELCDTSELDDGA
jgi:hypothetical protein